MLLDPVRDVEVRAEISGAGLVEGLHRVSRGLGPGEPGGGGTVVVVGTLAGRVVGRGFVGGLCGGRTGRWGSAIDLPCALLSFVLTPRLGGRGDVFV